VNLIGDHTDYNEGLVLPLALEFSCAVAIGPTRGTGTQVRSVQRPDEPVTFLAADVRPGGVDGWGAYVAGVLWAFREQGIAIDDYDIVVDANVPIGAGLSSSAALECAVALALNDLSAARRSTTELAQLARRSENDFVGVPCGIMDQLVSLQAMAGHVLLIDTRTLLARPIPLELAGAGLELLVIDSRVSHVLADGQYAQRRASCATAARLLGVPALRDITPAGLDAALAQLPDATLRRRLRHVVSETARVAEVAAILESGGQPREIGVLLSASHDSLRDDYAVSVDAVDQLVDAAVAAGAYGARMTGGGFGGSIVALIEAGQSGAVLAAVQERAHRVGGPEPVGQVVWPAGGAERVR
jgi:galactokinase